MEPLVVWLLVALFAIMVFVLYVLMRCHSLKVLLTVANQKIDKLLRSSKSDAERIRSLTWENNKLRADLEASKKKHSFMNVFETSKTKKTTEHTTSGRTQSSVNDRRTSTSDLDMFDTPITFAATSSRNCSSSSSSDSYSGSSDSSSSSCSSSSDY